MTRRAQHDKIVQRINATVSSMLNVMRLNPVVTATQRAIRAIRPACVATEAFPLRCAVVGVTVCLLVAFAATRRAASA
jgi:hypothetical protein